VLLGLLGIPARSAAAQVTVDLWPSIGGYFPLKDFDQGLAEFPGSSTNQVSQGAGLSMGLGGTVWVSPRFGIGLNLATAGSGITRSFVLSGDQKQDGRVSFYGAELLVRVSGDSPKHGAYLAAGPTVVDRSGEAFEGLSHSSSVAGTLSFGSYYRMAEGVRLRGDLSGLLYRIHLEGDTDYSYPPSTQLDILMRLGVAIDLSGLSKR
jgi:hypothetical protein